MDILQLLTKPLHMDVHRPAVAEIVKAPHFVQQLVAGIDPVGRGGQVVQQLHLLGGRVDFLAVHDQLEGIHIDNQLVEYQSASLFFGGDSGCPAEHRLNPSQYLLHFKGLGNIVVGTGFQATDLVVGFPLGGEHDDGHLGFRPDGLADAPAVHHRHHHIQQHQVGLDGPEFGQSLTAVVGYGYGVAFLFQIHLQKLRNIPVVFRDQNRYSHVLFLLLFPFSIIIAIYAVET